MVLLYLGTIPDLGTMCVRGMYAVGVQVQSPPGRKRTKVRIPLGSTCCGSCLWDKIHDGFLFIGRSWDNIPILNTTAEGGSASNDETMATQRLC